MSEIGCSCSGTLDLGGAERAGSLKKYSVYLVNKETGSKSHEQLTTVKLHASKLQS